MFEYIRGNITDLNPASVIIETGGIGYYITISLNTYSKLNGRREVQVYTHPVIREDAHLLYGFADLRERSIFRNLITVNGVGSATAMIMLSYLSPDEIVAAISTENIHTLKAVKGIGLKTAQRIIIDLKDKIGKLAEPAQILISADNTIRNEALSALVMLGFVKRDAEKAVNQIVQEQPGITVESVIKQALKSL